MTYLLILIAYALAMIFIGAYASRRVHQSSDFFVAGRELSAGLVFATLLAANIGAGSTVGATGLGYRDGMSAWWWVGSAGIGSMILAFTVGPRIWRVARDQNLFTVGDYLEFRYDRRVRGVVALLLWVGSLAILAGQLIAVAWILNVVAGVSKPVGCVIGAGVATLYFTAGGLLGTAKVNALQLFVKLLGFVLALWFLLRQSGGFYALQMSLDLGDAVKDSKAYLSLTGIGAAGVLRYLALLAPSFVISPGLLQKVFGARDERAVRRGVALNALGLLAFAIVPALLGMIARTHFPALANRELALPTLLVQALPLWLGGLLLGAIFSAEVSSADAVLFMLSTSLTKDLYKTFINPAADDRQMLRMVRGTALVCGALGAVLGMLLPSVIDALKIFYTLMSAALLLPLLAGLYTRRVRANAALAAIAVSVTVTFVLERGTGGAGLYGVPAVLWGTGAGTIVMTLWQMVFTPKSDPIHNP
ncbi:MAG: sodium:solute symporter family protein [Acidobacteria bacterium]|nr:sodium:solute symporter family protein [Acidobacteriota bacterium]MBI3421632.1 sodium:solute symporter family protein [Acidobacteriota bacterium]